MTLRKALAPINTEGTPVWFQYPYKNFNFQVKNTCTTIDAVMKKPRNTYTERKSQKSARKERWANQKAKGLK